MKSKCSPLMMLDTAISVLFSGRGLEMPVRNEMKISESLHMFITIYDIQRNYLDY